jgi:phosphatidylserine decarboxylase
MGVDTSSHVAEHNLDSIQRKHRGRSWVEGARVVAILTLTLGCIIALASFVFPGTRPVIVTAGGLGWLFLSAFVLFFFRDAKPQPPLAAGVILSPAHGTIDYIDTTTEERFLKGPARRISIYLSLLNVHVQHAPASSTVEFLQHFPGRWSRAIRRDASLRNEHLLVGLAFGAGRTMALRLISGIWVRRIVPWIEHGQHLTRGERIGLIRFGSRVDVLLPLDAQITVEPGDRVRGGETILARFDAPFDSRT